MCVCVCVCVFVCVCTVCESIIVFVLLTKMYTIHTQEHLEVIKGEQELMVETERKKMEADGTKMMSVLQPRRQDN